MNDSLDQLLEKLSENEIAIGRLYRQFSETFTEDAEFWKQMSVQEQAHSEWIGQLREFVRVERIGTGLNRLHCQAISTSIHYINSVMEKCRQGEIAKLKAYAIAYDIENSLLEKKFITAYELGSASSREIQSKLIRETENHRKKIGGALAEIRRKKLKNKVPA